jgi:hypothetical protein
MFPWKISRKIQPEAGAKLKIVLINSARFFRAERVKGSGSSPLRG